MRHGIELQIDGRGSMQEQPPCVELCDVSFAYSGDEQELTHVSFSVLPGETVSLVGPSGCGKSTLLRLIAGALAPKEGSIHVNNQPVKGPVDSVGFVPQEALLFPWRTVLANVTLPLELKGLERKAAEEFASKALEMVSLSGVECKYPHQLSGGMKQRVAIARALVHRADLLLLDEPFASVDAVTRGDLHQELMKIKEQTGATVILVTHNLIEAVLLSDKVLVLGEHPGRVIDTVSVGLDYPRNVQSAAFQAHVTAVTEALVKGGVTGGI